MVKVRVFCFVFCLTGACGILVPQPRIEPGLLNWKHGVLTTGHQGSPTIKVIWTVPSKTKPDLPLVC